MATSYETDSDDGDEFGSESMSYHVQSSPSGSDSSLSPSASPHREMHTHDVNNGNIERVADSPEEPPGSNPYHCLISQDSLKHGFYEDAVSAILRVNHKHIEIREIVAHPDSLRILFASNDPNDRLLNRYGTYSEEKVYEWHTPLQGGIFTDCVEINGREIRMRKSESGTWGRLSSSTSNIRSSNYTPSRSYGSSLSSYRYTPSSTYTPSSYSSSYTPSTERDRTLTRSSTTSASTGRSLTRSDSLSGSSSLARSPSTNTSSASYHRSLYSSPASNRTSSYSSAVYTPSTYQRDSSVNRTSAYSSATDRYESAYTPSRNSTLSSSSTLSQTMARQDPLSVLSTPHATSARDHLGRPRSSSQIITTGYRGPSVRELNRAAAERDTRDKKVTDYRDWEERERIQAEVEPSYVAEPPVRDFRKRADGTTPTIRTLPEPTVVLEKPQTNGVLPHGGGGQYQSEQPQRGHYQQQQPIDQQQLRSILRSSSPLGSSGMSMNTPSTRSVAPSSPIPSRGSPLTTQMSATSITAPQRQRTPSPESRSYLKKDFRERDLVGEYTRKPTAKVQFEDHYVPPVPPPPPASAAAYSMRTTSSAASESSTIGRRLSREIHYEDQYATPIAPPPPPAAPSYSTRTTSSSINTHSSTTGRRPSREVAPYEERGTVVTTGFTGLRNIGNTCFMNATLQMLVNTVELKDYFLNDYYKSDVNQTNVLGFGGRLAAAFADFMRQMWSCTSRAIEPAKIKELVAEKASQFANFAQHDAHEFLSFLLDGLHEDLNRVRSKAVTTTLERDGRDDGELAAEAWRNHLLRNDSIFVDLFHGQLKSRLQCPKCDRVSITFDPFVYLPVPFPKKRKTVKVIYWPIDPILKPFQLSVSFNPEGTVYDFLTAVGEVVKESGKNMRLCEMVSHRLHKVYAADETTTLISTGDILYVFQVHNKSDCNEDIVELYAVQRQLYAHNLKYACFSCGTEKEKLKACEGCYNAWYCNEECQHNDWNNGSHREDCGKRAVVDTVGQPFLVSLPKSHFTYAHLLRVLEARSRHSVDIFLPPQLSRDGSAQSFNGEMENGGEVRKSEEKETVVTLQPEEKDKHPISPSSSALGMSSNRRLVLPETKKNKTVPLFVIKKLRSHTSTVGETIRGDKDEILDIPSGSFISINWTNVRNGKPYVQVESKSTLDLDLEKSDKYTQSRTNGGSSEPSLEDMIQMFSETERLKPEESWYCNRCKDHVEATKKLELYKLPPILIIQLKRFVYTASYSASSLHRRSKDERCVNYPLNDLNLKPFLSEMAPGGQDMVYDLCGVVCHSGSSYFGHYISMGRLAGFDSQKTQCEWRNFDDSIVSKVSPSTVQSEDAYLLFYKQRGATTKQIFKKHYGTVPEDSGYSSNKESNSNGY